MRSTENKVCTTCFVPLTEGRVFGPCPVGEMDITADNSCPRWQGVPERITTSEALMYADREGVPISRPTLHKWCKDYQLGVRVNKRFIIYTERLRKFLDGDTTANEKKNKNGK